MAFTFPVVLSITQRTDVDNANERLYQSLIRAQQLAKNQAYNTVWGVYIDETNSRYVIFSGDTYASRNTALDESIVISPDITFTGSTHTEIVFEQITGKALNALPITINVQSGAFIKNIEINATGLIIK